MRQFTYKGTEVILDDNNVIINVGDVEATITTSWGPTITGAMKMAYWPSESNLPVGSIDREVRIAAGNKWHEQYRTAKAGNSEQGVGNKAIDQLVTLHSELTAMNAPISVLNLVTAKIDVLSMDSKTRAAIAYLKTKGYVVTKA